MQPGREWPKQRPSEWSVGQWELNEGTWIPDEEMGYLLAFTLFKV